MDIIEVRKSFKGFGFLGMSNTQRFSTTSKSSTTTLPSFSSSSTASTLPSSSTLTTASTTSPNDEYPPSSSDIWDSDDDDGWQDMPMVHRDEMRGVLDEDNWRRYHYLDKSEEEIYGADSLEKLDPLRLNYTRLRHIEEDWERRGICSMITTLECGYALESDDDDRKAITDAADEGVVVRESADRVCGIPGTSSKLLD
ncbi:hypothetical protein F5877DRAFT_65611 [Lentinula edodes]|nr:hypothetical protein F5877DRAFT_65611 [Lentinula edodes]